MSEEKDIPPDEIQNGQPSNLKSTGNEFPLDEPIAGPTEFSNFNTKPSTSENMEVHAHTHSGHGKKTWKEYFWEFLMLFLAVFCGFLAEYQLEHVIEHQRESQYIESLTSDLQDDIKSLDKRIANEQMGIAELDTLIYLLDNASLAKQNGDQLYYVTRMGPRSQPFANNSRTFDQLKNSGGFRLIRNAAASNNIMGYYGQFPQIRLLEDNYNHEFDNFKRVAAKIFDPAILRRQEGAEGEIFRSHDNPQLRTYDADLLKELSYHTLQMNGSRRSRLVELKHLETVAKELMAKLQKDYHLN
ncbi:MAG: hypothetical protein ABIP35_01265 [Ginsengibacter sp.]